MKKREYKGAGHRKRLREKFLKAGLDGFLDYEIIELLLTLGTPRKDCKQMAKKAIKKFGNLSNVLEASLEELQQIKGIGPHNVFGIKLFRAISERNLEEKLPKKIKLSSSQEVVDYLKHKFGNKKKEYFLILCLDSRGNLIKINTISIGSLNANIVHPREVFKGAISALADSVILVHNHPSGSVAPSKDDIEITERLVKAGKLMDIRVTDHIIISKNNFYSLKNNNLI